MTKIEYNRLENDNSDYICSLCLVTESDSLKMKWGDHSGFKEIQAALQTAYNDIVTWHNNVILVPRGKVGKMFITEVSKILQQFNTQNAWAPLSLLMMHVFVPLMLQKPSMRSKNKDHIKHLSDRLALWKQGKLSDLMEHARVIQSAINKTHLANKKDADLKSFSRLMLQGKIKQALKFVDEDTGIMGVHDITPEVIEKLKAKHPQPEPSSEEVLLPDTETGILPVHFENIDAELIAQCAKNTHGSGGPTKVDADIWKNMLCSRAHVKESAQLCEEIAYLTRRLCWDKIPDEQLSTLFDCRLVPLRKTDGGFVQWALGKHSEELLERQSLPTTKMTSCWQVAVYKLVLA